MKELPKQGMNHYNSLVSCKCEWAWTEKKFGYMER